MSDGIGPLVVYHQCTETVHNADRMAGDEELKLRKPGRVACKDACYHTVISRSPKLDMILKIDFWDEQIATIQGELHPGAPPQWP